MTEKLNRKERVRCTGAWLGSRRTKSSATARTKANPGIKSHPRRKPFARPVEGHPVNAEEDTPAIDFDTELRCTCQAFLILLACAICATAAAAPKPPRPSDGTFVRLEPIPDLHEQPGDHWFHENTLTIKGNAVTLREEPVVFRQGKKLPSDSESGFYTYRGTLSLAADGNW